MNKYKIITIIVVAGLLSACAQYTFMGKRFKPTTANLNPYERIEDTTFTGFGVMYEATIGDTRRKVTLPIYDTIPFVDHRGEPGYYRSAYEVYYYKGVPRFTKLLEKNEPVYFEGNLMADHNLYPQNIMDFNGLKNQIELGLEIDIASGIQEPDIPSEYEYDMTTNYKADDIDYILAGSLGTLRTYYTNDGAVGIPDSMFTYIRRDGIRNMSAMGGNKLYPTVTSHLRYSDFVRGVENLSSIPVWSTDKGIDKLFAALPDSLLNGKSCNFVFDMQRFKIVRSHTPECFKHYLNIRFKDGTFKRWSYYRCAGEPEETCNTINNFPWLVRFVEEVEKIRWGSR